MEAGRGGTCEVDSTLSPFRSARDRRPRIEQWGHEGRSRSASAVVSARPPRREGRSRAQGSMAPPMSFSRSHSAGCAAVGRSRIGRRPALRILWCVWGRLQGPEAARVPHVTALSLALVSSSCPLTWRSAAHNQCMEALEAHVVTRRRLWRRGRIGRPPRRWEAHLAQAFVPQWFDLHRIDHRAVGTMLGVSMPSPPE